MDPKDDKDKKKIAICPECETEVKLEENDGECQKCGLPVAGVLRRVRVREAEEKLYEQRKAERLGKKKPAGGWEL